MLGGYQKCNIIMNLNSALGPTLFPDLTALAVLQFMLVFNSTFFFPEQIILIPKIGTRNTQNLSSEIVFPGDADTPDVLGMEQNTPVFSLNSRVNFPLFLSPSYTEISWYLKCS